MHIKTALLIVNPCDDEYDNMAMLCCHGEDGEPFSLTRFPDEDQVDVTVGYDNACSVTTLKVTFSATRLVIDIEPADARQLAIAAPIEILHASDPADWAEIQETLQIILDNVGTYVCETD